MFIHRKCDKNTGSLSDSRFSLPAICLIRFFLFSAALPGSVRPLEAKGYLRPLALAG